MEFWLGVVFGWGGGSAGMYFYLRNAKLLKTRDEYYGK